MVIFFFPPVFFLVFISYRTKAGQQFLRLHLAKLDGLRHTKKKSNGRLHVAVATAWERLGDYHKARDLLQAAVRLCPEGIWKISCLKT